jgi:DHA1 family putative efflux transporter-like MFS transporter
MLATSAPNYVLLLLSRLVIAAAAGVFEVVATAAAARLVQPHERGRAIALIVAGFSIALIVGVPLGTIIGSAFTWRAPFVVLAGLAVGAGLGLLVFMPSTAAPPDTPESAPAGLVRSPAVVYVLVTTGLVFSGQYIAWTYLASFLAEVTRVQADAIALTLLLFGLGSAGGNFVGGHAADRFGLRLTLLGAVASLIVSLVGLSLVGSTLLGALAVVVVWAMAIGAFVPAQQYLLVRVAPEATSLGLALNLAALNGGIALGAALGGLVVYTGGLPGVGVCGALATALAVPTLVRSTSKA